MLTRVKVHNFKSIGDCDIDFKKGKYKYLEDMIYNDTVANPISFYGTNGSGKSSFLKVFETLALFMIGETNLMRSFEPNKIMRDNFEKGHSIKTLKDYAINFDKYRENKDFSSYIILFFTINKKNYEYKIATTPLQNIICEYLKCNNETIFIRKNNDYEYKGKIERIDADLYPTIRKLANDEIENGTISTAYSFLSSIAVVDTNDKTYLSKDLVWKKSIDLVIDQNESVREILKKYNSFPQYSIQSKINKLGDRVTEVVLDLDDNKKVNLSLGQISAGMFNQSILLSIITTLPKNSVLVVDELENALHPITILNFLDVIKEKNIQLLFSSHNTFILSKLRPDQIFFANWKNGFSDYKKLSDIYPNIREINNIERMYLSNLFDDEIRA